MNINSLLKAQILKMEPHALFTHCYGHALSLSVTDTVKKIKCLGATMVTIVMLGHRYKPTSIKKNYKKLKEK